MSLRWRPAPLLGLLLIPPATAASFEQSAVQVEKQARLVREAAERFVQVAQQSEAAGRPVGLPLLEAENEAIGANLRRLRTWVGEL